MKSISILTQEMQEVLTTNILPYWMERMVDEQYGGFYGCITGKELFLMLVFCGRFLLPIVY